MFVTARSVSLDPGISIVEKLRCFEAEEPRLSRKRAWGW